VLINVEGGHGAAAVAASSSAATRAVFGTVMLKEFGELKKN
jgi:hypothetical protein